MSVFPLNIETKEDHPDKVVKLQGVPTKYYLTDAEINVIYAALTELFGVANALSAEDISRIRALIFQEATLFLERNLNNLEKGVLTNVTWSWSVRVNDDLFNVLEFDGVDISENLTGNQIFNIKNTVTKNLVSTINRNGNIVAITKSATSIFYVPQYQGKMTTDDPPATYLGLSAFTKLIQSSTNLFQSVILDNEHLFFLVNSETKEVYDNNTNLKVSLGDWNSATAEFISKTFGTTLDDGTIENLTLIRTREKKTQTLNLRLL
jgi:hypothetical protein